MGEKRKPGRPGVGPKVQVHVPKEEYDFVTEVQQELGIPLPDLQREVYSLGVSALRSKVSQQ
jgi:hypothetical protein